MPVKVAVNIRGQRVFATLDESGKLLRVELPGDLLEVTEKMSAEDKATVERRAREILRRQGKIR